MKFRVVDNKNSWFNYTGTFSVSGTNVNWNAYIIDETPLLLGSLILPNYTGQFTCASGNFIAP